jgi:hypothetical protein
MRCRPQVGANRTIPQLPSNKQPPIWQIQRAALEIDLLAGLYAQEGRLPSQKELQASYGVSFRTMRKILRAMTHDRVLHLSGRRYYVPAAAHLISGRRIVFITLKMAAPPWTALNNGQYRILELFEQECIRRNLTLDVVEIDFYDSVKTRHALSSPALINNVLGYAVDVFWYPGEIFRRSYLDLLDRLAALRKPISLLDELGDFALPIQFAANPLIQVFSIAGRKAGNDVARALLNRGHTSVAVITSQHNEPYSQKRIAGIVEEYEKAGCEKGIHQMLSNSLEQHMPPLLAISGFGNQLIRRVIAVGRTAKEANNLYEAIVAVQKGALPGFLAPAEINKLKKNIAAIANLANSNLDKPFFDRMSLACLMEAGEQLDALSLAPLFEKALSIPGVTAWICLNDLSALAALHFLREHRLSVPNNISVFGFDNRPVQALGAHLSTYDFNAPGFVHTMLNFIARPAQARGAYRHQTVEMEGVVVLRGTTGKARV